MSDPVRAAGCGIKMAHDPTLAYADYFAAGSGGGVATLVPEVDAGEHELYGVGAEMFGVRGLMPASAQGKAALVDVDDSSTVQYVLGEQHHNHHYRQLSQQESLSLSLHGPAKAASLMLYQHHQFDGGAAHRQHQQTAPAAWHHQGAGWHLRGSRLLLPTQQLLQEFCSIPVENSATAKAPKPAAQEDGGGGSSSSASWTASTQQIQTMDAAELQRLKAKLYTMLEEVDRRYRRYCEQMRAVAGSFEAVAGEHAAEVYTRLASRTISRHFRSLRDGVVAQAQAVRRALGEKDSTAVPRVTKGETPRLRALDQCLRQHKAYQSGMLETHPWRPQRGLPERAVSVLRAWLFEHFLHPYPSDVDKHILARQTGLSRSQVSNWFINARVRLWKPMVEEMYAEEMKDQEECSGQSSSQDNNSMLNRNLGSYVVTDGGGERKPTRAQLVQDAGSLASVVSIGGGRMDQSINFGMMDHHLDFDAYETAAAGGGQGFGGGGGVSLTLGLQQQHAGSRGGVNVAFATPTTSAAEAAQGGGAEFLFMAGEQQMGGVHGQFGAGMEGDAASHYRPGLRPTGGFQLLHDLAG